MKAILKGIRASSKKVNVVAGLIRGMGVVEALNVLKFTAKKSARILYKVLHSAVSNAEKNDNKKRENLIVGEVIITKGPFLKRFLPSTRGRALKLNKPTAHITIKLADK
jgi:large subunit ribosomal protein L22